MKLLKPLVSSEGKEKVAFVDPKSLTKDEAKLVKAVDAGHKAEAELTQVLYDTVKDSEFSSAEIEINSEKGSYLRVATIDGVVQEDGKETGSAIVHELVNGHMSELMGSLNEMLENKLDEVNEEETVDA